jgi:hypothetical protein
VVDISGEQNPGGRQLPEAEVPRRNAVKEIDLTGLGVVEVSGEQDPDGRRLTEAEVEEIDLTGPEPSGKVVHATLYLVDVDGYVPFPAWDDGRTLVPRPGKFNQLRFAMAVDMFVDNCFPPSRTNQTLDSREPSGK